MDVVQVQKLLASDGAGSDQLGVSAALDGTILAVGAYADDGNKGHKNGTTAIAYRTHGQRMNDRGCLCVHCLRRQCDVFGVAEAGGR